VNWMGCGQVNKILDFWLYERWEILWLAERWLASCEGFCPLEELMALWSFSTIRASTFIVPIPVPEPPKARVCVRSLAGSAGSNPASGMGVFCESTQVEVSVMGQSFVQRSHTNCGVALRGGKTFFMMYGGSYNIRRLFVYLGQSYLEH
jgi:hypothetical protein